jgi:hypothetical protein
MTQAVAVAEKERSEVGLRVRTRFEETMHRWGHGPWLRGEIALPTDAEAEIALLSSAYREEMARCA